MKAALVLEDGTIFEGLPFAAQGEAAGEAVFYTGVVGFQEVATDPSYGGTLLVLTYPIVGTYGVSPEDSESERVHAAGVVIRDYSARYSNFRATGALEDFLAGEGVVGVRDVDTRAVAVHLRDHGEMKGLIASGDAIDPDALAAKVKAAPSPFARDLVAELPAGAAAKGSGRAKRRVAVLDLGVTRSLTAQLAGLGCAVELLPADAPAEEVLAAKPKRLVLAGGPGDPRLAEGAVATVKGLLGKLPILGIGLGHQVLALALGCAVERMKVGHHGVNQPVRDLGREACEITVQHHSFVVKDGKPPAGVEVTHRNVNDGSIEGLASPEARARGVQFHPAPDDTGRPGPLLARFVEGGDA